jgi:TRAP-type C4-dicarboxylate transport system substrate-binding protein
LKKRRIIMGRKRLLVMLSVMFFFAAIGISVCMTGESRAAEGPIELKVSHFWPPTSFQQQHLLRWKKKLEEDSKGRLTLRIFPSGTLLKPMQEWEGLLKGVTDIVYGIRLGTAGRSLGIKMSVFTYGGTRSSIGVKLMYDVYNQFKDYRDEWEPVKVLWFSAAGPAQLHSRRPVRSLEDLKGMQIRTAPAGSSVGIVRSLGATPVTMPMSEGFMALQKGMVDGIFGPSEVLKSFRFADVTSYTTNAYVMLMLGHYVAMNRESYNKLPPDLQKVIDNSLEWGKEEWAKMTDEIDEIGVEYAKGKGHEFIDLSENEKTRWMKAIKPVQDEVATELDSEGYPGTKLKDFMMERIKYYSK